MKQPADYYEYSSKYDSYLKLIELAKHIIVMQDDSYLSGHPEWNEIVNEAKEALIKP